MKKLSLCALLLFILNSAFAQLANIGQRTYRFNDTKRARPLITELWYPTTDTIKSADKKFSPFLREYTVRDGTLPNHRLPLIMLSHGTGGGRLTMEWLAQALAKSGFIVAAVDHWGNTFDNKIAVQFLKVWDRPEDISFVLTQLLHEPALKNVINPNKIGATGFSVGGYTVLALAGAKADFPGTINNYKTTNKREIDFPEYKGLGYLLDDTAFVNSASHIPLLKDKRIKAFFAICPGVGPSFSKKEQFKSVDGSVFIVGAAADFMAPVKTNARHFHRLISQSRYYEFPGMVGHYVMLNEAIDDVKKSDPIYFVDDATVNRRDVHLKVDSLAVGFFKTTLR
ncbi:alpha/beta hydrolase family protein [Mucilaginibacter ginkgonis]|uniref:Dienelactone hydrolase family protein n=1 Tax=Mucilaginibacter ginkgonis TaxID=2682091 RepID=A0A6I4ING8_9SPHI|nr:dienelactone hydrolase family protein [Mucilaginibacter ginkgonis]QQL48575.1 dienelactone hydrolase family protein [Mucilaginibacter ginkgonis]